jgi:hypothetical protein
VASFMAWIWSTVQRAAFNYFIMINKHFAVQITLSQSQPVPTGALTSVFAVQSVKQP